MDIQKILELCSDWTGAENIYLKSWFNKIALYDEAQIIDILKDYKSVCGLYYIHEGLGMSRQTYARISQGIKALLDYYNIGTIIPSRDSVLLARPIRYLYKNLESLISEIDVVGDNEMQNYDPSKDLLPIKAIAILGWHGLSLAEIASVRKNTLREFGAKVFVGDKRIEITSLSYSILENLSKATSYRTFPAGKIYFYQGNEHLLFRNTTNDGIINDRTLKNHLVGFNSVFEKKYKSTIKFVQLKKNAMFSSVPQNYTDEEVVRMFESKPYEYAHRAAIDLLKEYWFWKKTTKQV